MADFRLSERAEPDLIEIYDYTEETFGVYQADAYHAGLVSDRREARDEVLARLLALNAERAAAERLQGIAALNVADALEDAE